MEESMLSAPETAVLTQIAAGEIPHNQRAQALLAYSASDSLADVAAQSGLTENQVKYWWGRFRTQRLTIFPEELVTAVAVKSSDAQAAEAVVEDTAVPAKPEKKKKKPSKDKKKKSEKKKKKKKEVKGKPKKKKDSKKKKGDKKKDSKKKKKAKKK